MTVDFGKFHLLRSEFGVYIRVDNSGTDTVTLTEVNFTGDPEFFVTSGNIPFPHALPPGGIYILLNFNYQAIDTGKRTAELIVSSDLLGSPDTLIFKAETINTNLGPLDWKFVGHPLGDRFIEQIYVDPRDDSLWYVYGGYGFYITRDGGNTWEQTLPCESCHGSFALDPTFPDRIYKILSTQYDSVRLYVSDNRGLSWDLLHNFPSGFGSATMLISSKDGTIYVPSSVGIEGDEKNPGMYRSSDHGLTWQFFSYGIEEDHIIVWDMAHDTVNEIIYVCTEIGDHPRPYNPPFFRSLDNGETWEEISYNFNYHASSIQVNPINQDVYIVKEGGGLYKFSEVDTTWEFVSSYGLFEMRYDPNHANCMFGSTPVWPGVPEGGIFYSEDGGYHFERIGLSYLSGGELEMNGTGSKLFTASYGAGIFMTQLPEIIDLPPVLTLTPNTHINNQVLCYQVESSENGTIFVVPAHTEKDLVKIREFAIDSLLVNAYIPDTIVAVGLENGAYWTYAVDSVGNISDATPFTLERIDPPIIFAADTVFEMYYIDVISSKNGVLTFVEEGIYDPAIIIYSPLGAYTVIADSSARIWISLLDNGIYWLYVRDKDGTLSDPKPFHYYEYVVDPPELLTPDPVSQTDFISVRSSDNGRIYLVPKDTEKDLVTISNSAISTITVLADSIVQISLSGLDDGVYWLYASDYFNTISDPTQFTILRVGVPKLGARQIKIYPNPTKSLLNIQLQELGEYSVKITSINGGIVLSKHFTGNSELINLSSIPDGIYFITVQSTDILFVEKIIKLNY